MNDILGHDIDGRPLRAGDEVVVVESYVPSNVGKVCRIVKFIGSVYGYFGTDRAEVDKVMRTTKGGSCNHQCLSRLRKLHKDHRPADESFAEMMKNLKQVTA